MSKKKRCLALILTTAMLATAMLSGCSSDSGGEGSADGGGESGGEKLKLGGSLANMSDDFTITLNEGGTKAGEELGDEVEFIVEL